MVDQRHSDYVGVAGRGKKRQTRMALIGTEKADGKWQMANIRRENFCGVAEVLNGRLQCWLSAVPSGLKRLRVPNPNVETLGYSHWSLRDCSLARSACIIGERPHSATAAGIGLGGLCRSETIKSKNLLDLRKPEQVTRSYRITKQLLHIFDNSGGLLA